MNILHLTPYYAPAYAFGGVVRSVEGMARALARRGHQVTVLTTDALDSASRYSGVPEELRDRVRVLHATNISHRLRGRLNLSTPGRMQALARELLPDIDVVHCHEFRTMENLLVTPIAEELNKPLILSPHGTLTRTTGRSHLKIAWDKMLSPIVAQRFRHVLCLTPRELDDVQTLWTTFDSRKTPPGFSVIPNGIDPDEYDHLNGRAHFRTRYHLGEGPVCLYMGRLHERKGVQVLIEAFKAARVPAARLVIAGPDEGMLARITPLLDDTIILTGYLEGPERLAAFAAADVFALPAIGEGLPMVALEAMGTGLPVILSPGCSMPEAAEYGAGLIVEPACEPLSAALRELLTNPTQRESMGRKGQQLIRNQFTWDAVAVQLEQVYRSLTAVVE
ncbi:MAG: glycosyltransferase [Anaerolineae bacterium]|nr:glycosyltransferase [Anaerolineae bacterium]